MCLGMVVRLEETWDTGGIPMGRTERSDDAVCLAYVPEATAGDHVLVHLGFALEVLETETATDAIAARRELGAL